MTFEEVLAEGVGWAKTWIRESTTLQRELAARFPGAGGAVPPVPYQVFDDYAGDVLERAGDYDCELVLPADVVLGREFDPTTEVEQLDGAVMAKVFGLDIAGDPVAGELSDDGFFAACGHDGEHTSGMPPRKWCKSVAKAPSICYIDLLN